MLEEQRDQLAHWVLGIRVHNGTLKQGVFSLLKNG